MYRVEIGGNQYFAPDLETLQIWANEGRILPTTSVYIAAEQRTIIARAVPGLNFPQSSMGAPPIGAVSQASYPRGSYQKVDNNLALAIFSAICCGCLPLGVVAIVYAAQVDGYASRGEIARAQESADKAKTWAISAITIGMIFVVLRVLIAVGTRR